MSATLFVGGARSGKSAAAEQIARSHGGQVAVVAFGRRGVDAEFDRRIDEHQSERPAEWRTIEPANVADWASEVDAVQIVLVDCVGTWLSALAEDVGYEEAERLVVLRSSELSSRDDLAVIFVSNEVGSSLIPLSESGRAFSDALGRINQHLGRVCARSYLCIAGFTLPLNELATTPTWRNVE